MKQTHKIFRSWMKEFITIILCLCCLVSISSPARAAGETDATYAIRIDLSFSDSEEMEHNAADYQAIVFLAQDANELYLVAEYDQENAAYRVTGKVESEADATRFQGGMDPEDPGRLQISGLGAGSYTIAMIHTADGYVLLKDIVRCEVSGNSATVNDTALELYDGHTASFKIIISRGFILPDVCGNCRLKTTLFIIGAASIVVCGFLIILLLRTKRSE